MGKTITQCSNSAIAVKVASSVKPMTSLIKFTDKIRSIQHPNAMLSIVIDNGKNQFKADILK
jgi:hypothetical protein